MIEWRLTTQTQFRFQELMTLLSNTEEGSDESEAIKETIRSLPGFPTNEAVSGDVHIFLEVTNVQH